VVLPLYCYAYVIDESTLSTLAKERYWHLLLHMNGGVSEIDDPKFFLADNGKTDAKAELVATLKALLNEHSFDDNATGCRFPARKAWLQDKLQLQHLPKVECREYQKILTKLNPTSATVVFPAAHINSPASMFGHTFLRIDSEYDSKLLSYAINYAANVDESKTNSILFAVRGLTGGYRGLYSMLPYYEKLKEYRDSEQRDIWEYDLDLNKDEVRRMFEHIWELNGIYSDYYFFNENCSYNLLWLIELAKRDIYLRDYFTYHVSPLETIHAMEDEGLIRKEHYRASKRTILLMYEDAIDTRDIEYVNALLSNQSTVEVLLGNQAVSKEQKQYILEAAIELLEYTYMQGELSKEDYLEKFHQLTIARASLGMGKPLIPSTPASPLLAHRQARITFGVEDKHHYQQGVILGIRPVYHDLEDSSYGLLRGTQIEFLNTLLHLHRNTLKLEKLTLLSISSISQISEFIQPFSWRTHFQWDREYLDDSLIFNLSVGAGASWGNRYGYFYMMTDLSAYADSGVTAGGDVSLGLVFDKNQYFKTNIEATRRWYSSGHQHTIIKVVQSYAMTQNTQLKFDYRHTSSDVFLPVTDRYRILFNYYF